MPKEWVKRWKIRGSNSDFYTVAVDKDGNWGCSCPVWKFRRQECKHIVSVKNNPNWQESGQVKYREAIPANVGQVTIKGDTVLYPLVPFGNTHLAATILYDLQRAGVNPSKILDYKEKMFRGETYQRIFDYVKQNGRYIFTQFVEKEGWKNPVVTEADYPCKRIW